MSASSSLICFLIYQLFIFQLVDCHCSKEFMCGTLTLSFPFTKRSEPNCGLLLVDCESLKSPIIQIQPGGNWRMPFRNRNMSLIYPMSKKNDCSVFNNINLPKNNPAISLSTYVPNVSLLKCNTSGSSQNSDVFAGYTKFSHCEKEHGFSIYYNYSNGVISDYVVEDYPSSCSIIQWQLLNRTFDSQNDQGMFRLLDEGAFVYWNLYGSCKDCYVNKYRCRVHPENYTCSKEEDSKHSLILGTVIAGATFILICLVISIIFRWKKWNNRDPYLLSSDPSSSKADVESGIYFGASVYSYADLEKATDTFASSRELGKGGFGIVYHGKLEDGRDVAVKRLYEHNYKRMEQFINEIRILTNLAHPNLVSLYGCTSKLSRELLLVYEYVPNGTLADHIHGEKASASSLTWPIRMNIALQTANALAYLHKSDIIHRDVKTNNILLDHNFNVKVADFGLSRLFPNNVTHVSTAPQGTPGYVDPEYHECYQLTDKSDVYSFGVVLVELISSLTAVDVKRNRHEINLANFAMRKIQTKAVHELIDPTLEYESNPEVRRMMNSTAELAFCCLQLEKQMRPRMDEIVDALETIKNWNFENKSNVETNDEFDFQKALKTHPSPESDEAVLIKHMKVSTSPISITDPWISESSTSSWSRETF